MYIYIYIYIYIKTAQGPENILPHIHILGNFSKFQVKSFSRFDLKDCFRPFSPL